MTEAEWLACTDPRPMIGFLRGKLSSRKARLFAVASCRLVSHLFSDDRCNRAVEIAERFADGLAYDDERSAAWVGIDYGASLSERTQDSTWWADSAAESSVMGPYPEDSWYKGAILVSREVITAAPESLPAQLILFRCIVGNPFRSIAADLTWLTASIVSIAEGIYVERAFDQLPILADALEEAGCDNAEILDHLRSPGPHFRGCWALDLILDKC